MDNRKFGKWVSLPKALFAFLLLVTFLIPNSSEARNRIDPDKKYQVMATMISKFLVYIEWPELAENENGKQQVELCIFGENPFEDKLQLASELISSRAKIDINISENTSETQIESCDVAYLPKGYAQKAEILSKIQKMPILSITEGKEDGMGIINFVTRRKLHFIIDNRQAKGQGIKIKSGLLKLAKEVIK